MDQNQSIELMKSIEQMAEILKLLLKYIDEINEIENSLQTLIQQLNECQILQNKYKMIEFLTLIISIISNHNRNSSSLPKIQRLLKAITINIKELCQNSELFNIFIKNKRILLFVLDEKIITLDSILAAQLILMGSNYIEYFYLELEPFLPQKIKAEMKFEIQDAQLFKQYREIGENENYIANIIRNDSLDSFTSVINQSECSINEKIPISFFESNPFLLSHKTTLLEYAAFFGSIKIFKYLLENHATITQEALLFGIHGKNIEIIQLLEDNVEITNEFFKLCLLESIRCNHNDLVEHFLNNQHINLDDEAFNACFESHNYTCFCDHFSLEPSKYSNLFIIACKYDYYLILQELVKANSFDVNNRII